MAGLDVSSLIGPPQGPSGLFASLSPQYQLAQNQAALAKQQLAQEQLFQGGLPTDPQTGQTDWNAAYSKAMQGGAYDLANNLISTGIRMSSLNDPATLDNPTARGQAARGSIGGAGALPAAGGGMIAPSAGGDDNGVMPSPAASGGSQGAAPGSSPTPAPMDVFAHSIGAQESSNRYDALGPKQKNGDQGIGYYQVMASNVGPWTQEVLGQAMSPQDFLANPQAQDAVFRAKFGQAIQQYGSPADAASVWFSGRPLKQAGNASDSLGTTAPAYVQKFLAGLGPASQALRNSQGQPSAAPPGAPPASAAGATSMPAGGQPQPISFGSGDASSAPGSSPATGGAAPSPTAPPSSGAGPDVTTYPVVTDAMMSSAQANIQAGKGGPQDYNRVRAYAVQHNIPLPPGHAQMEPEDGASDGTPSATAAMPPDVSAAVDRMRAGQGTSDDKATFLAWKTGGQATATTGASPGVVDGSPASVSGDPALPGNHPYFKGIRSPTSSSAPMQATPPATGGQAPQGGGFQPISFGGGAPASQPGPIPPQVAPGTPPQAGGPAPAPASAMPPNVAGALARLQSNQGSAADGQIWGAYQASLAKGGATPAVGQGGATPAVGQGGAAAASGPDLPTLPAGYQDPGGGTRYVNDVMAKAAQFAQRGDPRAPLWEARAKQVQDQLVAAQTFQNNLSLAQARADDRYNAMNSPGAIAAAGQRAGAETTARNNLTLMPSVQPDGTTLMIPASQALDSANAGKPIVSQQPGYVTTGQGNLLAKLNDGSKAYQERQVASQRLDALSGLLETYQTGANSTAFNDAVANLRSVGIPVPNSATLNPGAMQEFTKNGYANVLSSMKEQGNKQYAAEVSAAVNSNPNPDLQPEANAAMIAQMQGIKRYTDQNFRDYSTWYHGNKGAADDADFQTSWADQHPLGSYVSAAAKDIAPAGVPLPPKSQLVDGQAYQVQGQKVRWNAGSGAFVPFTASSAGSTGSSPASSSSPPAAGARQAPDGNWYVSDPARPGKYLQVAR